MSYPSILSPWYVLQRLVWDDVDDFSLRGVEFYTAMDDGSRLFQPDKRLALLFMSLQSAVRVSVPEAAEVRVLTTLDEAKEFGRE